MYDKSSYKMQVFGGLNQDGMPYVCIGDTVYTGYKLFNTATEVAREVLHPNWSKHPKEANKEMTKLFGCTPSKFLKLVNGIMYKIFIASIKDKYGVKFVNKYCYNYDSNVSRRPDNIAILSIHKNSVFIDEVIKDGLMNLVPFVIYHGKTPSVMKASIGKYTWKRIAKNSLHRNLLIAKSWHGIEVAHNLPSTLLKDKCGLCKDSYNYIAKHCKGIWGNPRKVRDVGMFFQDTKNMLLRLGKNVNINWSLRRLQEEHDRASKELLMREYPNTPYTWIQNIPSIIKHNKYTAELLTNSFDIAEEGLLMRHCVAFYAETASLGDYVVYSIKNSMGERYSTLGLTRDKETGKVRFQQHYRKDNLMVRDADAITLADIIVDRINNVP